ncbi:MAG: hypothetical protein IJV15_00030 [Lachnospiraceae bacterium]|nr:hypothetical protein [Lachnospiraceae bacterium]
MKYQVLGHKRKIQKGDKPYEVVAEFDNLEQLYFMMDKVDRRKYDGVLVIDTYTNELVASREFEKPLVRRLKK